jgi:hypothetical protein
MYRNPLEAWYHGGPSPQRVSPDETINQLAANAIRAVVKELLTATVAYNGHNTYAVQKLKDIANAVESKEFSELADLKARVENYKENLKSVSEDYSLQCEKLQKAHQKYAEHLQNYPTFKSHSIHPYVMPVDVTVRFSVTDGTVQRVRDFLRAHGPAAFHSLPVKDFKVVSAKRAPMPEEGAPKKKKKK